MLRLRNDVNQISGFLPDFQRAAGILDVADGFKGLLSCQTARSVDHADMEQLQTVNQVVEALNSSERMRLLYLCGSSDTDPSAESLKEVLGRKVLHRDSGQMLLSELVMRLRRFDILRKVCKTSRDEMEKSLSVNHFVPTFR